MQKASTNWQMSICNLMEEVHQEKFDDIEMEPSERLLEMEVFDSSGQSKF